MNNQLAIFILFATLSFFNSKAQSVDSLKTDILEQVTPSAKDTLTLIPSISENDSVISDTIHSLPLVDTAHSIIDTVVTISMDSIRIDSTSTNPNISPDSISTTSNLLIETTPIKTDTVVDSNYIQKDIIADSTIVDTNSLGNIPTIHIDSTQLIHDLNNDTLLTDLLETLDIHTIKIDSNKTETPTDTILPTISLDTITDTSIQTQIDSLTVIQDSTSENLIETDILAAEEPLDSIIQTTQKDTLVNIDSLLPVDTYEIIEIDTLKPVQDSITLIDDSTTTTDSIKTIDSSTITDSVPTSNTPYEKLTGDALVDSIMNASMIEIQNTPKPKTDKPAPTSLESYSVEDLPTEISFVVHAYDSITKTPLKASVLMSTLDNSGKRNNGTGICNSVGYFSFFLTPHSHFEITVSFPDYIPIVEEIDFTKAPVFTPIIKKEYALKKFQVGDVIHLKDVNFKQGDFHLQREAFPVLDKLAKLMLENPKMVIKLKGHTDNSGSPSANITLSESRITEVRYYLLRKGIKLNRLKGEGYGGGHPLVPNNCPENMQKNRRVEFEVLKI